MTNEYEDVKGGKLRPEIVVVVAIDYEKPQGHLAFGTSIWRTEVLKQLYDWESEKVGDCECIHMWKKVHCAGLQIETLPYRAKHLKS